MQSPEVTPRDQNRGITQLRGAALAGNIEGIRAILSGWRGDNSDERFVQNTAPILSEAIENDSAEVVETLLDYHVPMNSELFLKATRNTSYRILQAFLRHGWELMRQLIHIPLQP